MRVLVRCIGLLLLGVAQYATLGSDFDELLAKAEALYAEGSFAQAHELYSRMKQIPAEQQRWVKLRLAETEARSEASSRTADNSRLDSAKATLRNFVEEDAPVDKIWAQAQETLGDLEWIHGNRRNWGAAWPCYEKALGFWAASTNLNVARQKYWNIVSKAAEPPHAEPYIYYGGYGAYLPLEVLENALKIALTDEQKARAHFMIAMTLRNQGGDWEHRFRIPTEFEESLKSAKGTRWYADALYFYAEWMNSNGKAVQDENGNWTFQPDYAKALQLFRRLTTDFRKGQTQWFDAAKARAEEITKPVLNVSAHTVFLPGSEIEFYLNWRNVTNIEFKLYRCDLVDDISFNKRETSIQDWLESIPVSRRDPLKSWSKQMIAKGVHLPGGETIRLDEKLPTGAYLLQARSGKTEARELLLVSDLAVVVQGAGHQALVYVCDSAAGAPVARTDVRLWERYHDGSNWHWNSRSKKTDDQGIALFELDQRNRQRELFVAAKSEDRQAFSNGSAGNYFTDRENWKVYAFTDRPAYRPAETVHWKLTARTQNGETYSVPSSKKITLSINDPRGAEFKKITSTLNSFGSAWGEIALGAELPLGEYRFTVEDAGNQIATGILFRLEEYKLPEFKVALHTPEENGRKKTFLLGEKVEVDIQADYYFGGPVASATVEAVVYQSPLYHIWMEPREFEWFYDKPDLQTRRRDSGQVVQREKLQTDNQGRAHLVIQTPLGANTDLEYRIEARVTDASRREIVSTETVRVGRQRFYVYPQPAHRIYKPRDKVTVDFKTVDANDQPVAAEGKVQVTRDFWYEIWTAPDGHDVQGPELETLRKAAIFPPPTPPGTPGWRPKSRGYRHEDILTRTLKSDTNGLATLTFTPEREGYYRLTWRSDDEVNPNVGGANAGGANAGGANAGGPNIGGARLQPSFSGQIPSRPIRAETTVWVATTKTSELGYRSGGLEILVDKDSFKAGEKAPVMLTVPTSDSYVLLTVTGTEMLHYELIHLSGSVKLVELPIGEEHVPNFFLNGVMIAEQQMFAAQQEIVVPPVKNFLDVKLTADREQHRPGEKGTLQIRTRDSSGQPVSAEIALGVIDESVFYIQQDYAGDPRKFFFGTKRPLILNTSSSFNSRPYRKILPERERKEQAFPAMLDQNAAYSENRESLALGLQTESRSFRFSRDASLQKAGVQGAVALSAMAPASMPAIAADALTLASAESAPENAQQDANVQVRSDFRSTIFWQPDIKTDSSGRAEISFTYPDSLTSWKSTARAATTANQFGIAHTTTRTKQPFIVRLQAPRFFLAGDTVTVSAVLNNNTDDALTAAPVLEGTGIEISNSRHAEVTIAAGGEARVDWILHPKTAGEITLKVSARAHDGDFSDAMEKSYTVYEHGIEKFLAVSGKSRGDEVLARLVIPSERKAGSTRFSVQVTPSMAVTMLDALPYLIDYPYGCTEQTMSRFLPAAITSKTLQDLGLDAETIMGRVFGGIEQNTAAKSHPEGKRNLQKLGVISAQGLQRLYDFQHDDGGWGWWKEDNSDRFMTAYVVWGLVLARDAGIEIREPVLDRAVDFLDKELVEAVDALDEQAWLLHPLALYQASEKHGRPSEFQEKAWQNLWQKRERLNAYSRALLALSAHYFGKVDEAKVLVRNLENGVKRDRSPASSVVLGKPISRNTNELSTAHWGEDGIHWRWSEGGVEATAFALRALLAIDPKNELVEPVANWLIKNRRGAQWSNTRDTAIVILALNDYLRVTKEAAGELDYEVFVNGASIGEKKVSGAEVFSAPASFDVPSDNVHSGTNEVRIVRKGGDAPIYFAAQCSFFSLEEPVEAAGNEIFAKRQYFRLEPVPTLLKGFTYDKVELQPGDTITSGERIETVITIEAKNNYEYLVFEDLKAAGVEAVEVRSGESLYARRLGEAAAKKQFVPTARKVAAPMVADRFVPPDAETRPIHQELRDRKIALFIDKLPEGFWQIRYESRAEIPGEFHALPLLGHAMYVPEIRANSAESKIIITETKEKESK